MADFWKKITNALDDHYYNKPVEKKDKSKGTGFLGGGKEKAQEPKVPYNYRLEVPKIAELDAVKVFNEAKFLTNYLSGEEDGMLTGQNFERTYLNQEPRILWEFEKCRDIGELVLLFPNPDYDSNQDEKSTKPKKESSDENANGNEADKSDDDDESSVDEEEEWERQRKKRKFANGIKLDEALNHFNTIFRNNFNFPGKKQFMTALTQAFTDAFIGLEEFKPITKKEKEEREKIVNEKKKAREEAKKEKRYSTGTALLEASLKANIHQSPSGLKKNLSGKLHQLKNTAKLAGLQNKKNKKDKAGQGKKAGGLGGHDGHGAAGHEVADLGLDDQQIYEQEKLKSRIIWFGGTYSKPESLKTFADLNEFKDIPSNGLQSEHYWNKQLEGKVKDFLTLIRKVTCVVLANQGLVLREIFVNDGREIAIIVSCPELNLQKVAPSIGLTKVVEFGVADLMSLEPVDGSYRPLRLNAALYDKALWKSLYLLDPLQSDSEKAEIEALRTEILHLLAEDCNFKVIARRCGAVWTDEKEFSFNEIYSHHIVTIEAWKEYCQYLKEIAVKYLEIDAIDQKMNYVIEKFYSDKGILSTHANLSRRIFERGELIKFKNKEIVRAMRGAINGDITLKPNLKNIWHYLNLSEPIEYSFPYEPINSHMRPRKKVFYNYLWQDYFVNYQQVDPNVDEEEEHTKDDAPLKEKIYHHKFTKLERIKVVDHMINRVINLTELRKLFEDMKSRKLGLFSIISFLIDDNNNICFPLHDPEHIDGKSTFENFKNILKYKSAYDEIEPERKKIIFQKDARDQDDANQLEAPGTHKEALSQIGGKSQKIDKKSQISKNPLVHSVVMAEPLEPPVNASQGKDQLNTANPLSVQNVFNNPGDENEDISDKKGIMEKLLLAQAKEDHPDRPEYYVNSEIALGMDMIDKVVSFSDSKLEILRQIYKSFYQKPSSKDGKIIDHKQELIDSYPKLEFERDYAWFEKICDQYKLVSNLQLCRLIKKALLTSQPIRNTLPLVFKHGELNYFRTHHDNAIKYPIKNNIRWSIFNHSKAYPEATIRQYFGEKLALYFGFMAFYRDRLVYPSLFGTFLTILLFIYRGIDTEYNVANRMYSTSWWFEKLYEWSSVVFSVFICAWIRYFEVAWVKKEAKFSCLYGQINQTEKAREVRPSFVGIFSRSVVTDKVNCPTEDPKQTNKWLTLSNIFLVLYSVLTAYVSFAILQGKREAYLNGTFGYLDENSFFIEGTGLLFNFLEFCRIKGFEQIFFLCISWLIKNQNLKYMEEHESRLILNCGLYQLFNNSITIMIIGIQGLLNTVELEDGSEGSAVCAQGSCIEELNLYFFTYCILLIVWSMIVKLIVYPLTEKAIKLMKKIFRGIGKAIKSAVDLIPKKDTKKTTKDEKDQKPAMDLKALQKNILEIVNEDIDLLRDVKELRLMDIVNTHHRYPYFFYHNINKEIDRQVSTLKDYKVGDDYDQSLFDYLELFNMISIQALFGVLFPISFILVAAIATTEWYMDNRFLLSLTRRPTPSGAYTIGLWLELIKLVGLLASITNSFFISFILFERKSYTWKFSTFLLTSFLFLFLGYVFITFSNKINSNYQKITERITFIQEQIFKRTRPTVEVAEKKTIKRLVSKIFNEVQVKTNGVNFFSNFLKEGQIEAEDKELMVKQNARALASFKLVQTEFEETKNTKGNSQLKERLSSPKSIFSKIGQKNATILEEKEEEGDSKSKTEGLPDQISSNLKAEEDKMSLNLNSILPQNQKEIEKTPISLKPPLQPIQDEDEDDNHDDEENEDATGKNRIPKKNEMVADTGF